ncbi:hypothetical protein Tco_0033112 [Tanacetum coccineum]
MLGTESLNAKHSSILGNSQESGTFAGSPKFLEATSLKNWKFVIDQDLRRLDGCMYFVNKTVALGPLTPRFLMIASLAWDVVGSKSFLVWYTVCLRNGGLISWRLINLGSMKLILTEIGLIKISTSVLVEIALPVLVKVIHPVEIAAAWDTYSEMSPDKSLPMSGWNSLVQQHQMKQLGWKVRLTMATTALARVDNLGLALVDFKTFARHFVPQKVFPPAAEFNESLSLMFQGIIEIRTFCWKIWVISIAKIRRLEGGKTGFDEFGYKNVPKFEWIEGDLPEMGILIRRMVSIQLRPSGGVRSSFTDT